MINSVVKLNDKPSFPRLMTHQNYPGDVFIMSTYREGIGIHGKIIGKTFSNLDKDFMKDFTGEVYLSNK